MRVLVDGLDVTNYGGIEAYLCQIIPKMKDDIFWLFGGFCGRDSGIGPAQRAKTTIWN